MKVCIDIQAAIAQRAGVGRYTKSLVEQLGTQVRENDALSLFYFDFKRQGIPFPVQGAEQQSIQWCPGRIAQQAWKRISWPPFNWFASEADVYHFPNFVLPPLTHGKAVVTIHDVSFLRMPETTETKNLSYLNSKIRDTVKRADAIITDSAFSANEIEELLGVPDNRLFPIHLGLADDFVRPDEKTIQTVRDQQNLDRPYLLTVGTLEPRKNIPFLVEVFEQLTSFEGTLVIAGMRGWKYEPILERIQQSSRATNIKLMEYVEDGQLPALYAGAELFVFPSLYEGFGLPPLEAMKCGTAVVASHAGSLPEVLGDAAHVIKGYDAEEWASSIQLLLQSEDERQALIATSEAWTQQFSWEETARATWDVYRKVSR